MDRAEALRAWLRWQGAAGPWQGWAICPLLLSPEIEALRARRPRHAVAAERLAQAIVPLLAPGGVLCLLDLEPELAVRTAARLAGCAHPLLVLPRWPYARAVLPAERLASTLLAEARQLPASSTRRPNVVMVLDAHRACPVPDRSAGDRRADNRYTLSAFDLPSLAVLRTRGIARIHRVSAR